MHACYTACMNAQVPQYTIRNISPALDSVLRRRAKQRKKSLNAVVIEELEKAVGLAPKQVSAAEALKEFFGVGFDPEVAKILDEDDRQQKELTRREWGL